MDPSLFHYALNEDKTAGDRGFQCGSVIFSDRFAMLAAHCLLNFGAKPSTDSPNTIVIRDDTGYMANYAVRRYFSHPEYRYPLLYYDIAIAELSKYPPLMKQHGIHHSFRFCAFTYSARRVEYNFDKFGDSPACLGEEGTELTGASATSEGYGQTETGTTSNKLLTVNVTLISNEMCKSILNVNTSRRADLRARLYHSLQKGLNDQIVCSMGEYKESLDIWSGPCKGDSGGPLFINHGTADIGEERRQVLIDRS